jgi:hypothetical protein
VPVDDADVGQVELLEEEARRPVRLERLLEDRPEPLDPLADARRQPGERLLGLLARVVQLRVEAHAVEIARQRAHVRGDRHPVVVHHDHDRHAEAARVVERLEGHAAGERAVPDDGHHAAVLGGAPSHRLLDAHCIGHGRGGVARAHGVVLRFRDRAERRETPVLADGVEAVAASREDLVRIGLVAHVPEDLVARRVEERMDGHRHLAGAQIGAEVPADLADRVDDQRADLLRHLLELVVVERLEVVRAVDLVDELGHVVRVSM